MDGAIEVMAENYPITPRTELPPPSCPTCKDTGWVYDSARNSCTQCACLKAKTEMHRHAELIRRAGLSGYEKKTLDNYFPKTPTQGMALKACRESHRGFFFYGPPGVGKSHLMAATVNRMVRAEKTPAAFLSVPRLLDLIRRKGRDTDTDIELQAIEIPYLALDDIGKERVTDWTEERLFLLIEERYRRFEAATGHTSFTSQFSLKALADRMDPATVDRIKGMTVSLFMDGASGRGV